MECKYDTWEEKVTTDTGFPGYGALDAALAGFDEWIAQFVLNADDYSDYFQDINGAEAMSCYCHCYEPWNMQARHMVIQGNHSPHFTKSVNERFPSLDQAKLNLQNTSFMRETKTPDFTQLWKAPYFQVRPLDTH
jgi:hypothetical protein